MKVRSAYARQGGFSLIEVLVAVIILSIGLLGVATLQITSKRGNFEAMQRSAATLYAEDLVERMRSNPSVLSNYTSSTFTEIAPPTPAGTCVSTDCDADDLAAYDLETWWDLLIGQSEDGLGGIVSPTACLFSNTPAGGGTEHIVAIAWRGMDQISDTESTTAPDAINDARNCGRTGGLYDLASDISYRRFITLYAYIDPFSG